MCCLTAAHPAGAANLSLLVDGVGYALHTPALQPFTYVAPPQLLSISPAVGHVGSLLTLVGSGLSGGGGTPAVSLGGAACAVVQANDTHISCTAAASPLGSVPVAVTVSGAGLALHSNASHSGSSNASTMSFMYRAVVTAIAPTNGSVGGGLPLTLTGAGFDQLDAPAVTLGGQACEIQARSSTEIVCAAPALVSEMTGMEAWINSFY